MFQATPIIKRLFWINAITFIVLSLLSFFNIDLTKYLALWDYRTDNFQIWQFITYQFLHAGALHIIFNMIGLLTFGPTCEEYLGEKKFIWFYLISGIGAAFIFMILTGVTGIPMVGASGSIYGLLALFGILRPNDRLQILFIPIAIKAKYIIGGFILSELVLALMANSCDHVGHWAHIGGAITATILYFINKKFLRNIY